MKHVNLGGDLVKMIVGRNILRLIAARPGMTQAGLARALNRVPGGITHYVNGVSLPDASALAGMAAVFGVDVHELFVKPPRERIIRRN